MWGKEFRGGHWLAVAGCVATLFVLESGPATAAAAACAGAESDYNGDGIRDTAIADPEASIAGKSDAGAVTVVYGAGAGSVRLARGLDGVPGAAQTGGRFGYALAQTDLNGDGCSDLIIGSPYLDVGAVRDAGAVHIIYGAPGGLGSGLASTGYDQAQERVPGDTESGDLFGYALAAGNAASGAPYLAIGVPGEDIGTVRDAGAFNYIRGSVVAWVDQDSPGAPGLPEQNDRYGAVLAGTPGHLVVGSPGEAIGDAAFAGGAAVFGHTTDPDGRPAPLAGIDQSAPSVGAPETGDRFGTALAAVPMLDKTGAYKGGSYLAVSSPGEDLGTVPDAGMVTLYRVTASGSASQWTTGLQQEGDGINESADPGDFFGQELAATLRSGTLRVAVGVPGEESSDEHLDKGGVQIFAVTTSGTSGTYTDEFLDPGWGIPGEPTQQMFTGTSLAATPDALLVGVAYGPGEAPGAVYGFDWEVASGGAPMLTLKPGEDGLPAGGKAFGAELR